MGELARKEGAVKRGAVHVIRSLGLVGLYTGVTSCLARDGEPPRLDVLCPSLSSLICSGHSAIRKQNHAKASRRHGILILFAIDDTEYDLLYRICASQSQYIEVAAI